MMRCIELPVRSLLKLRFGMACVKRDYRKRMDFATTCGIPKSAGDKSAEVFVNFSGQIARGSQA